MDRRRARVVVNKLLSEAGFSYEAPDPNLAWNVLMDFSAVPVPKDFTNSLCEIGTFDNKSASTTYINLTRQFKVMSRGEFSHFMQLRINMETQGGRDLANEYMVIWSDEFASLEEFRAAVESQPLFQKAMAVPGWSAQVCFERV